ncbi:MULTISPECIES: GNAT family N-acetyltransferase [unclassified Mycolicibacterium]|uniref:GNAT family N-acetyltransferase n=1 Tax=unclassified Mycolicibacterium TaxID=2636767 RepID=UPI0028159B09|nr:MULTISPECIES: GNAT family N-acetyltransferase [unclassified Mycolicibacterium]
MQIVQPSDLSQGDSRAAEALVRSAFGDSFRAHDWLHGVDGVHVLVTDDGVLLAHAAVVTRTLSHADDVFDTGYVEGVAVRTDQQGRGLGRLLMDHTESIIRASHDIGALNAVESAATFYAGRGWQPWDGPTQADTPSGVVDTYDTDDRIFLLPTDSPARGFAQSLPLICDWRVGDLW